MTKEQKIDKLLAKKSDLEDKLFNEQCRQFKMLDRRGWGHGMRNSKIGFSTRKEDNLKERIEKINKQIETLRKEN